MKNLLFLLGLSSIFLFTSCEVTDVEISFNQTEFEGVYATDLDCNDAMEDAYGSSIDISIYENFGSGFTIELDDNDEIEAVKIGNKLIIKDQKLFLESWNEVAVLNGEITEVIFDDLIFEYTIDYQGKKESCVLDLEADF